jgi:hypothetical protein
MKILVIGFQRSGTTLLRRIIEAHPEVKKIFHEVFLMKKFAQKEKLYKYLKNTGILPDKDIWGEKVPYYPSIRRISVVKYCSQWKNFFEDDYRILHIVRHPLDIAFSVEKMYGHSKFENSINIYKKIIPIVVPKLDCSSRVFTFKYEDLLIYPKRMLSEIFSFCNLNPKVNIFKYLETSDKSKYRKLNPSRAFAYKGKVDKDYGLKDIVSNINKQIGGIPYEV